MRPFLYAVTILFYLISLTACGTVATSTKIASGAVKATGKLAVGTGKIVYHGAKISGDTVMKATKDSADMAKSIGQSKTVKGTIQAIRQAPPPEHVEKAVEAEDFGEALLSPLSDVNLRKQKIPVLLTTLETPYDRIPDASCAGLAGDLKALDTVLGPDMDRPEPDYSRPEKTKRFVTRNSVKAVEKTASSFIPFRWVVRAATGASAHEKNIQKAYRKGVARRGYLRGLYQADDCFYKMRAAELGLTYSRIER